MFRRRRRGDEPQPADDLELAEDEELAGTAGQDDDLDLAEDDLDRDEDGFDQDGFAQDEEDWEPEEDGAEAGDEPAERSPRADLGDPETWTRLRDSQSAVAANARSAGPWDSGDDYPEADRIDFGSLLVPVREEFDVQVFFSETEGITIAVVHDDSGLQLQPFAAPRSAGLWHEVLPEIADEVARAGGSSEEQDGPFGAELTAIVVPQGAEDQGIPPQPLRFFGADGPRWFLRGLLSGPAATDRIQAGPFEEIFADVVVVRGEHAEPPRKPLEIRLPDEARQALEEQQAAAQDDTTFNPFERGPEITETR